MHFFCYCKYWEDHFQMKIDGLENRWNDRLTLIFFFNLLKIYGNEKLSKAYTVESLAHM